MATIVLHEEIKVTFEESKYLINDGNKNKYDSEEAVIDNLLGECQ